MKIQKHRVLVLLANKGWTQAELAKQAGICRQAINTIIHRGTCEPRTAGKIARALNIAVEELMEDKND